MATDSDDSNRHPWKRTAWRARDAISESLVALPADYPPRKAVNVHDYHEMAQTYLFEYFSVFEPKKGEFGGDVDLEEADAEELADSLWWEPLIRVRVPVDGTARLNGDGTVLADDVPDSRVLAKAGGNVPERPVVLRLGNIRPLYQTDNTVRVNVVGWVPHQGQDERPVVVQRFLSVAAIQAVRSQLDRCLEEAGWLPDISATHQTEITEEMLEEVAEWREQTLG